VLGIGAKLLLLPNQIKEESLLQLEVEEVEEGLQEELADEDEVQLRQDLPLLHQQCHLRQM
jgi:hypothetical protein